ncbi:MAG: methylated-DNA--[protein]-cysteine S-methyltransferase [Phycisphaerae bacterium]|nr:methylated-DNA--[protein]-cysteine S-methyltransferase [Phycisphaerae bacterium]
MEAHLTDLGLAGLRFVDSLSTVEEGRTGPVGPVNEVSDPDSAVWSAEILAIAERLATELEEYFAGRRTGFGVPIDPAGTAFQHRVWSGLMQIPFGQTRGYAHVAGSIGRPTAVRAVARSNALNPIALLIPCHRVIGSDGSLTGYAGGLDRKRWLIEFERSVLGEIGLFA